jgi:hypothetical protein
MVAMVHHQACTECSFNVKGIINKLIQKFNLHNLKTVFILKNSREFPGYNCTLNEILLFI